VRKHSSPLLGLAYLLVLALLVGTSIAAYNKALPWQGAVHVSLTTTTPGLELNPQSDVKLQGLRVGEVRSITSDGRGATIDIAIDKDKVDLIPANVDAAIVPKTLFGEKFIDLRVPSSPSTARLTSGSVIRQSTTSVEIGRLFGNLVPVLRTLKPDQLSVMLTSLADALDGRGAKIARTLNQLKELLDDVDPHLGVLAHDLQQLATVSDVYADAAPDLMRVLSATSAISSELLVPGEQHFQAFLDQVGVTADQTKDVLAENAEHLVTLSGEARPVLALLDEYSRALPCFLNALHTADILANQAAGGRGPFVNLTVDVITQQTPYRNPSDLPGRGNDATDTRLPSQVPSWAPHCAKFAPYVYSLKDAPPYSLASPGTAIPPTLGGQSSARVPAAPLDSAVAEARSALARALAAQLLGVAQDDVPPYAELLLDPMLAQGEVTVK